MRKFRLAIWESVVVIWETKFAAKRVLGAVDQLNEDFGLRSSVRWSMLQVSILFAAITILVNFQILSNGIIILKFSRHFIFISRLFQKVSLKIQSFFIIFKSCWLLLKSVIDL